MPTNMVTKSPCLELQLYDEEDSQKVMCGTHDDEVVSEEGVKWICCTDITVTKDRYVEWPIYVRYVRMVVLNLGALTLNIDPT
jgi:hypothetical protein